MKIDKFLTVVFFAAALGLGTVTLAEESIPEKAETAANKAGDSVKSTYRSAKDKTCEMINGKLECIGKKIKNKALHAKDKIETKATETKNQVD